jgi:hypothetical protein
MMKLGESQLPELAKKRPFAFSKNYTVHNIFTVEDQTFLLFNDHKLSRSVITGICHSDEELAHMLIMSIVPRPLAYQYANIVKETPPNKGPKLGTNFYGQWLLDYTLKSMQG